MTTGAKHTVAAQEIFVSAYTDKYPQRAFEGKLSLVFAAMMMQKDITLAHVNRIVSTEARRYRRQTHRHRQPPCTANTTPLSCLLTPRPQPARERVP